jgi:hypothetical protein
MVRYKLICLINPSKRFFVYHHQDSIPASFSTMVGEHDMVQRSISCSARSGGSSNYRSKWIELFLVLLSVLCNMNNKLWSKCFDE